MRMRFLTGQAVQSTLATLVQVVQETPTVKRFVLRPRDASFAFRAGQWIDLHAPGVDRVGGYSICTSPKQLLDHGTFDVAVKRGRTDPTHWLHTSAGVGDDVYVRVGGEFVVQDEEWTRPRLFVAGGIGLTPLLSMLRDTWSREKAPTDVSRCHLVYTASTSDELAFRRDLEAMRRDHADAFHCTMHVTDAVPKVHTPLCVSMDGSKAKKDGCLVVRHGLVSQEDLHQAMVRLQAHPGTEDEPTAYVCGPPAMAEAMLKHLHGLGLARDHIRCERWW
eukprot:scaffold350_cov333-Pavlova_lutheri.AAC.29